MEIKTEKVIFTLFLFLLPAISFADGGGTLASLASQILGFVPVFSRFFLALALAYFLYGVLQYMGSIDNKSLSQAKDTIFYGIIGLFVMTSVWGLVDLIKNSLGL